MDNNIKDRVITIKTGSSNVYLIKNGKESVLIDAGNKNQGKKILKKMKVHGVDASDIALIVVTHSHYDHVGSLSYLKEKTGAVVLAHENEADNLQNGYLDLPDGTGFISRIIVWLGRTFLSSVGKFDPVNPDITINKRHEPEIEGLEFYVIPTPGHTNGSVSLILENTIAFVGDAAFNIMGRNIFPPFANDQKVLLESWETLLQTNIKYLYPGHGRPFKIEKLSNNYNRKKHKGDSEY